MQGSDNQSLAPDTVQIGSVLDIHDITLDQVIGRAWQTIRLGKSFHIVTVNPEIYELCRRDLRYAEIVRSAAVRTCDGIGVSWAAHAQHGVRLPRVTGVALTNALIDLSSSKGLQIVVVGGIPAAREAFERIAERRGARIVKGMSPTIGVGFDASSQCLSMLMSCEIVLVALGAPKQERLIDQLLKAGGSPRIYIGVGGAIDYLSGLIAMPPMWVRKRGLEWLARLIRNPRRRLMRQVRSLPSFLMREIIRPTILKRFRRRALET